MNRLPRRQPNGHFAVDFTGQQYRPAGNFNYDNHDRWVEQGHCPAVSLSKAWCCEPPHIVAPHRSIVSYPPGATITEGAGSWYR